MQAHILVPLDGSRCSEAILPHAVAMARATSSSLRLLQVIAPPVVVESQVWPGAVQPMSAAEREVEVGRAHAYLAALASQIEEQGVEVEIEVRAGDPATTIVLQAESYPQASLIAMATHSRSGVSRLIFGSVAEKVLHMASVPLLLVHGTEEGQQAASISYNTILVPLDGSPFAGQALVDATVLAERCGAALELVSVVPALDLQTMAEAGALPPWGLVEQQVEADHMHVYLEQHAHELESKGIHAHASLRSGEPAEEILQDASEASADLIVMATHGRGGWRRFWLGSVTRQVLRQSSIPVLLLRAQEHLKVEALQLEFGGSRYI